jgi:hypothetical protein
LSGPSTLSTPVISALWSSGSSSTKASLWVKPLARSPRRSIITPSSRVAPLTALPSSTTLFGTSLAPSGSMKVARTLVTGTAPLPSKSNSNSAWPGVAAMVVPLSLARTTPRAAARRLMRKSARFSAPRCSSTNCENAVPAWRVLSWHSSTS